MPRKLSFFFLVLALLSFGYLSLRIYERYQPLPKVLTSADSEPSIPGNNLTIPSIGLSLPIFVKTVSPGSWPLSSDGIINISGQNIYYGHNWPRLLGKLHAIKVGDYLTVNSSTYLVSEIQTVSPSDTKLLSQASSSTLILYTCTGFLDRDRLVVIAKSNAPLIN